MDAKEIRERQEFAFEASVRMRDRFLQQEVWERMGISPKVMIPYLITDDTRGLFQQMLFSKIVPNCKKLGLLDAADGWLRHRYEELGVISSRTGSTRRGTATSLPRARSLTLNGQQGPLVGSRRMAHQSDPHLLVAHALHVKGFGTVEDLARLTGLAEPKVESQLIPMLEQGLAQFKKPAGSGCRPPRASRSPLTSSRVS
jgi:hypothetical protein